MWLAMTVEYQRMAHNGMGETFKQCLGVFYSNDGMVISRDSAWLQHSMNILIYLFQRYGLAANIDKPHTMTCQPNTLRSGMSEYTKQLKCTEMGDSYNERLRRRIPCPEFGV